MKEFAILHEGPVQKKRQSDQKIKKKISQKVAQTVPKPKKAKISTTKLNLKAQKIYIKPLLKP